MHINYKGQFSERPASRVRKSAAAREGPDHQDADEDDEVLDLNEEEDQGPYSGRSWSRRRNQTGASGHEEEGPQAEGTPGRWATHNKHKVTGCLVMTACVIL